MAAHHGLTPAERRIYLAELRTSCEDGTIAEAFAVGTAAVITPIVAFNGPGYAVTVGDGQPGPHTIALRKHLLGIQHGRRPDIHHWMHQVV